MCLCVHTQMDISGLSSLPEDNGGMTLNLVKLKAFFWFYHVKCSFIFPFLKEMPLISQDLMSYLRHSLVKS